ncbi:MAG: hypothetical protein GSR86_00195 [Desulfurococcales archaeon]|nr:hypothetical protein [Desulfurococcales archaeon]
MGVASNGVGIIVAVCRNCGFKLYWYAIGDGGNKQKFIGPPTPQKILRQYDDLICPKCNKPLNPRPRGVLFMSWKDFTENYVVGKYRIYNRPKSIVERQIDESISPITMTPSVEEDLGEEEAAGVGGGR